MLAILKAQEIKHGNKATTMTRWTAGAKRGVGVGTHAPTPNLDPELVRAPADKHLTAILLLNVLSISNERPAFSPLLCRPILGEKWRISTSSQTLTFHTPLNGSLNTSTRARWTSTEARGVVFTRGILLTAHRWINQEAFRPLFQSKKYLIRTLP